MITHLRSDLIGIRRAIVWHYLLVEGEEVVALDTGMGTSATKIQKWFAHTGRRPDQLKAILLTHGHLDHAGCAMKLKRWSGAPIFLHHADWPIAAGSFPYRGSSRVCGMLESLGRPLFRYHRPHVDFSFENGQELPFWGGLKVVHLPGHTLGHVGFYSESKQVLFIGDCILSRGDRCFFPLPIFNVDSQLNKKSVTRTAELNAEFVYPMHHVNLTTNLMPQIRSYAEKVAVSQII